MSRKDQSPACSRVAGDITTPSWVGSAVLIVLVFIFEAYLLSAGYDVVTTLMLATAGVVIAGAIGRPSALRQLATHLPISSAVIPHG
ncbi:hypothetical protein [Amycolatopsis sp. lyj-112]|uniref:hypothetical protein n=1 Tax=Amycolatopsis sp. lyj-112 TaxID=2789288 RepID=UPI003979AC34